MAVAFSMVLAYFWETKTLIHCLPGPEAGREPVVSILQSGMNAIQKFLKLFCRDLQKQHTTHIWPHCFWHSSNFFIKTGQVFPSSTGSVHWDCFMTHSTKNQSSRFFLNTESGSLCYSCLNSTHQLQWLEKQRHFWSQTWGQGTGPHLTAWRCCF